MIDKLFPVAITDSIIIGTGATVTFTASGGAITSVTATPPAGGLGYSPSSTFNLLVSGGGGTLGIVSATTNSSGVVTSYSTTPVAGGSGYSSTTGAATTGRNSYSWAEQNYNAVTGFYTEADSARTGTKGDGTLTEVSNTPVSTASTFYAWARFKGMTSGLPCYEFMVGNLAPGAYNQIFTTSAATGLSGWQGSVVSVNHAASPYTMTNSQDLVFFNCDTSAGNITFNLPTILTAQLYFSFWVRNTGTGTVTITRASTDTINGATTLALSTQWSEVYIMAVDTHDWSALQTATASSGLTTTQTIVTAVSCTGTSLTVTTKSFVWTNGLLQSVT